MKNTGRRTCGGQKKRELPDEDTERLMYQFTKNILQNYGITDMRYQIMQKKDMNAGIISATGTVRNIWGSEPEQRLDQQPAPT